MDTEPHTPVAADISLGVAIIPSNPLKNQVAVASLAITKLFDNANIIDNVRFPAHISLYLGGASRDSISELFASIEKAVKPHLDTKFRADRLYSGYGGFIGIDVALDSDGRALFQAVINASSEIQQSRPRVRPHLISRWPKLTEVQRNLILQFGTYKTEPSSLHISVAQVDREDVNSAFGIATKQLSLPTEFGIESIQLVDVGHDNEKWEILWHCDPR